MKYFLHTLKHKWWVFWYGVTVVKCPIFRLITHDLSKLTLTEYPQYQEAFFGAGDNAEGLTEAWIHHQNVNDHHYEYWIPRTGHDKSNPKWKPNEPFPMPIDAVREMVSDWMGATRAYSGIKPDVNNWKWFNYYFPLIRSRMHEDTIIRIVTVLEECGMKNAENIWFTTNNGLERVEPCKVK